MRRPILIPLIAVLILASLSALIALAQETTEPAIQPTPQPSLPALPITADVSYTVQQSDTLDHLAATFDVQLECLIRRNELTNPGELRIGQTLIISADCPRYRGADLVQFPRETAPDATIPLGQGGGGDAGGRGYVVQVADTLDTIGQELNVSVVAIQQANNITDPRRIFPGDTLIIPDGPPYGQFPALTTASGDLGQGGGGTGGAVVEGGTYVVQPGDTLDTIGQELNVSVVAIQQANNIEDPGRIFPGTALVIPKDAPPYGEFPALTTVSGDLGQGGGGGGTGGPFAGLAEGEEAYVVQRGETLDGIAARFDVHVGCLAARNNITDPTELFPGQALAISFACPRYNGYDFVLNPRPDAPIAEPGQTFSAPAAPVEPLAPASTPVPTSQAPAPVLPTPTPDTLAPASTPEPGASG